MLQNVLAALGLLICLTLLLRMTLPAAQQQRFDAFWRRVGWRLKSMGLALQQRWHLLRAGRDARREAADAIERARRGRTPVQRDGNVIRPERFGKRDSKKPPLH
jgi:hypothetical protein